MKRLSCTLGVMMVLVLLAVPVTATPEALEKETPARVVTVHRMSVPELGLRHELAMLIAGTTLLVVAAFVRRAS